MANYSSFFLLREGEREREREGEREREREMGRELDARRKKEGPVVEGEGERASEGERYRDLQDCCLWKQRNIELCDSFKPEECES